jgi:hypothetical protein
MRIPKWKWDEVGMDFIVGLPCTQRGYDSIWVIVDRLMKVAHFLPVKTMYTSAKLAELYMERIVSLHGVPKRSCLIEVLNLCLTIGRKYMNLWGRS